MADERESSSGENLQGLLKEVRAVEAEKKYEDGKELVKYRAELRGRIRQLLAAKQHLPADSPVFAGLKKTNGRVNYREVLEELSEMGKIDDDTYTQLCEKHRKPCPRLVYGQNKPEITGRFWQPDFDFITPKGVLS